MKVTISRKIMFTVNGMDISTSNNPDGSKQVTLHDKDGSLLAGCPLHTDSFEQFRGIELMIKELSRMLGKVNKLTVEKEGKAIECCLHYSKDWNQYRITYNKPNSKYKPCTSYEDDKDTAITTMGYVVSNITGLNKVVSNELVKALKIKVNTATVRMNNDW